MHQTLSIPRLRLASAPSTPAELLQDLVTAAQMRTRFRQLRTLCDRLGVPMGALVIRVEGFARLREELGPTAALRSLAAAAEGLASVTRQGDEVGRWGDDELAVLCPGAEADPLLRLAEELVATLEDVRVRHDLAEGVDITLPLRVSVRLVDDLGDVEAEAEEDEAPPPHRLHAA
jgi:diguanylate cyclase (GGDEF)-like protein